ncbi:MAG: hypothetical protein M3N18_10640, partial [Actinomycetota bacterium]|nr:hypothetical protein [Actinomycetota bacterium]
MVESGFSSVGLRLVLLIVLASMSAALVAALVAVPERAEAAPSCKKIDSLRVPGAERQDKYCLADLTK